jgi:hypothetical protein
MIPCPDKHFAGIECATCGDAGRFILGNCTCGVHIHREFVYQPAPGGGWRGVWRYGYRDEDLTKFSFWIIRCRGCGRNIDETWMAADRYRIFDGAMTNVREV